MERYQSAAIIIPSLNPDEKLLNLLADLQAEGFEDIVIVNDGSSADYDHYFATARETYGCTVLTHAVNQGKGRALKTAFNHLLCRREKCPCAVTVDSDGQHRIADIIEVVKAAQANPKHLIMGCRDFSDNNVNIPKRSRFGNRTTSRVLHLLCGIKLSDTQTGLRGFSPDAMRHFMKSKGERFEYEMNMILDAREYGLEIQEIPIETVYIEENKTSHFNPLLDSFRIYSIFFKFILASMSSFVVDLGAYSLLLWLLGVFAKGLTPETDIVIATYAARVLSGIFNFTINKKTVFKSHGKGFRRLLRYALLSVVMASLSAFATSGLFSLLQWNRVALKLIVDCVLFVLSFRIQRGWVFKS